MSNQRNAPAAGGAKTKTVPGIRVRSCSPMGTFRRGGQVFEASPTELRLDSLKKEQLALIRGEPLLVVEDIEIPDAEPAASET